MAVVSPFNHNLNVQYISLSPRGTVLKDFSCFPQEQLMTDVFPHVLDFLWARNTHQFLFVFFAFSRLERVQFDSRAASACP